MLDRHSESSPAGPARRGGNGLATRAGAGGRPSSGAWRSRSEPAPVSGVAGHRNMRKPLTNQQISGLTDFRTPGAFAGAGSRVPRGGLLFVFFVNFGRFVKMREIEGFAGFRSVSEVSEAAADATIPLGLLAPRDVAPPKGHALLRASVARAAPPRRAALQISNLPVCPAEALGLPRPAPSPPHARTVGRTVPRRAECPWP